MKPLRTSLAAAAISFAFVLPAHATPTNVVPNPGFEQGCGGQPPAVCDWIDPSFSQDTNNPHTGAASGALTTFFTDSARAASTCTAIVPGPHAASLWVASSDTDLAGVDLKAEFFSRPDCTGADGWDLLGPESFGDGSWQEGTGTLVAPPGTVSVRFTVEAICAMADCVVVSANFDDLVVEDAVATTPAIGSFTPGNGPPGTRVDIVGWNFSGATSVTFNGSPASFTLDSDSEIHATVPAGASTGPISVTTGNGSDTSNSNFMVPPPPWITSFTPTSGSVGTSVGIFGQYFSGATAVTFNGASASFIGHGDGWINATVPSGATTGPISVTTPSGTATTPSPFDVVLDMTPPETTITSGPSGTTNSTSARLEFIASEPSTFQCSLDSSAFAACASPQTYTGLPQGPHTFRVRATDVAGNTDSTPAQQSWTVQANAPPVARFTFTCTALACSFDGSASSDPSGSVATYSWNFGDGTSGSGSTTTHSYLQPADYLVTLTVTDNQGATNSVSKTVPLISLNARGYKLNGLEKVDLSWSVPTGVSLDVYRNGSRIATVQGPTYTDNLNTKGPGTYAYKVCTPDVSVCSNTASVSF